MDKFEMQWKIFIADAVFMLLAAVSLAVVLPRLFQEASTGSIPNVAATAALVVMGLHLLFLLAFLVGIILSKRRRPVNKEINIAAGVVLLILGFMVMDGAFAYLDNLRFVSIGMFICVFGDFAAALVSVIALFLLKPKKKN